MNSATPNNTLVIECASEACSVALLDGSSIVASEHKVLGRGHAEHLIPMIAALPNKGRAKRILVSLGPGSFTGVRIGIASARALGIAWGSRVAGYPTPALIASECLNRFQREPLTVCMNGGHGEWFVQNFAADGTAIDQVQSMLPEDAAAACTSGRIAGNRAEQLAQLCPHDPTAHDMLPNASAAHLLRTEQLLDNLSPAYGRKPDAKLPQARQSVA